MIEFFRSLPCRLGRCLNCKTVSNNDGIGGQCVRCGKVHGWVTREELRAYGARALHDPQAW